MTALTRAGRQTDALRAYRQAAAILADRTGLEPGHELRRLETAILLQDPSLDAARWQPAPGSRPAPLTPLVGPRRASGPRSPPAARATAWSASSGPGGVGKTALAVDVASTGRATTSPTGWSWSTWPRRAATGCATALAAAVGAPAAEAGDPLARAVGLLARRETS